MPAILIAALLLSSPEPSSAAPCERPLDAATAADEPCGAAEQAEQTAPEQKAQAKARPESGVRLSADEGTRGARLLDTAGTGRAQGSLVVRASAGSPAMNPAGRIGLEVLGGVAAGAVGLLGGAAVAAVLQVLAITAAHFQRIAEVGLRAAVQPWNSTWLLIGGSIGAAIAVPFGVSFAGGALGGGGSKLLSASVGLLCSALLGGLWMSNEAGVAPGVAIPAILAGGLVSSVLAFEVGGLAVAPALSPDSAGVTLKGAF